MDLYSERSGIEGLGCFAGRDFRKGERIGEYTGEIISEEEANERYADIDRTYLFDIGKGRCIDALNDPSPVKYINHSCDPNCESVQEGERVFIVALRRIRKGEELTYAYNLQVDDGDDDPYACRCGAPGCRGTMRAVTTRKKASA